MPYSTMERPGLAPTMYQVALKGSRFSPGMDGAIQPTTLKALFYTTPVQGSQVGYQVLIASSEMNVVVS